MNQFLKYELKNYIKKPKELIIFYSLILILSVMFPITLEKKLHLLSEVSLPVLWTAIVCGIGIAGQNIFNRDSETGRAELYALLPFALEWIILLKWLAFYLATTVPLLAALPVLFGLLEIPPLLRPELFPAVGMGMAALTALTAFSNGLSRENSTANLLLLPLSIPLLLFSLDVAKQGWEGNGWIFLSGFTAFFVPVLCLSVAAVWRAEH